jgi:hypothetical protein
MKLEFGWKHLHEIFKRCSKRMVQQSHVYGHGATKSRVRAWCNKVTCTGMVQQSNRTRNVMLSPGSVAVKLCFLGCSLASI